MQHRADARHGQVELEVLLRVPRERRHPVAGPDAELDQRAGEPVDALAELGVAGAPPPVLELRDDARVAVHPAHALEHVPQREGVVVLYQLIVHVAFPAIAAVRSLPVGARSGPTDGAGPARIPRRREFGERYSVTRS